MCKADRFWNLLLFCWRNIDGIHDSLDRLNDLPGSDCVLLKLGFHGRLWYKFLWNPWSVFLSHQCVIMIKDHITIKTNQNMIPTVRFYLCLYMGVLTLSTHIISCYRGWTDPYINSIIDYCTCSSLDLKNVRYAHLLKSANLALPLQEWLPGIYEEHQISHTSGSQQHMAWINANQLS